ncbi:MAG: hypothetical protein C5B50_06025 [Verrucomicrobia bacterium]|nr:MAG: hypothetical protein C5B50_06025 [Verrucomicrobiota bacterium]
MIEWRTPSCAAPGRLPVQVSLSLVLLGVTAFWALPGRAETNSGIYLKTESFEHDPGWEAYNNHVQPARVPVIVQDFGYCAAGADGQTGGAIGGKFTRASKPAYYAKANGSKSLQDELSASGTFRLTSTSGNSGIFFGWFNSHQRPGSGRAVGSFGMDFDGEHGGARLAVRMISHSNKSCGTFITPFIPGKFRPTPIRNDGTRYKWDMAYDPKANDGKGRFTFRIQGDSPKPEEFEGKTFSVDLPGGFKEDGAAFDHFGLMNAMKPGGRMTAYFSDLVCDGQAEDLMKDPNWEGSGNRANYNETDPVGAHNFGFSPETSFAGGAKGEVGGKFWRSGPFAYYGDNVGHLSLSQPLEASGKVVLLVGAPDSDMYFGWFNSTNHTLPAGGKKVAPVPIFLGVHVGGPTRVGHYFQPAYSLENGIKKSSKTGPVLTPGKTFEWTLRYEPVTRKSSGVLRVSLGGESTSLAVVKPDSWQSLGLDRFGLFTSPIGGQMVEVYFDDLRYTASP